MVARFPRAVLATTLALVPFAGCSTGHHDTGHFMTSVNSIRPGTPMDTVKKELGAPDETFAGTMPALPPPGPLEAVVGKVPPGARYRHWVYKHDDSRFHIIFAQTIVQSGDRWEVVSVRSLPNTAVTAPK